MSFSFTAFFSPVLITLFNLSIFFSTVSKSFSFNSISIVSLSLIGSTGAAYADDHHNRNLLFRGGDPNAIETDQGSIHLTSQLQEFVAAIEEQREPAANGVDGQTALQVAEAAVASLESRQALRMIGGSYELV